MFSWETLSCQCSDRIPIKQQWLTGAEGCEYPGPHGTNNLSVGARARAHTHTHTHLLASLTYRAWFERETLQVAIFLSSELSEMESDLKGSEGTP